MNIFSDIFRIVIVQIDSYRTLAVHKYNDITTAPTLPDHPEMDGYMQREQVTKKETCMIFLYA